MGSGGGERTEGPGEGGGFGRNCSHTSSSTTRSASPSRGARARGAAPFSSPTRSPSPTLIRAGAVGPPICGLSAGRGSHAGGCSGLPRGDGFSEAAADWVGETDSGSESEPEPEACRAAWSASSSARRLPGDRHARSGAEASGKGVQTSGQFELGEAQTMRIRKWASLER